MKNIILTPVAIEELVSLIADEVENRLRKSSSSSDSSEDSPKRFIKGIHELAQYLQISTLKAQRLKNEGVIPCWQDGRIVLFDPVEVRKAMAGIEQSKTTKKAK